MHNNNNVANKNHSQRIFSAFPHSIDRPNERMNEQTK